MTNKKKTADTGQGVDDAGGVDTKTVDAETVDAETVDVGFPAEIELADDTANLSEHAVGADAGAINVRGGESKIPDEPEDRPLFWSVISVFVLGLILRLWDLGERALHHDESLDAWWSARFVDGTYDGYDPVFHGPLRFYITGAFYTIFGESPATARLFAALSGALLVLVPWFMRRHLGRIGTVATALFLALSPSMLYFSRFGREDAQIMFLSGVMIALAAMFNHRPRPWMPPVFALALVSSFAIKESTFLWVGIVGSFGVVVLAVQYERIARQRRRDAQASKVDTVVKDGEGEGEGELQLIQLIPVTGSGAPPPPPSPSTATRPPSIFDFEVSFPLLALLGLAFAVIVGAREWVSGGVFLMIGAFAVGLMGAMLFQFWVSGGTKDESLVFAIAFGGAFAASFGLLVLWILRPDKERPADWPPDQVFEVFSQRWLPGQWAFLVGLVLIFVLNVVFFNHARGKGVQAHTHEPMGLLIPMLVATLLSVAAFYNQPFARVPESDFFIRGLLFVIGMMASAALATAVLRYMSQAEAVEGMFAAPIAQRLRDAGSGSWLLAASVFLACFVVFFTVFFKFPADWFSGVTEAIGYWDSQQDVNRGGQPWYYYFVTIPAYEWLFILLALVGTRRALRQRTFTQGLLLWIVGASFILYSYAGERMPWLVVHPLLPILFLAGLGVQELWENRRDTMVLAVSAVLALGFVFTTYTSLRASFVSDTDGRELFVQAGQATEHVTTLLEEIEMLDQVSRAEFGRPLRLALGSEDAWPWAYYLKDYPYTTWNSKSTPEVPADIDVLIANNFLGRGSFFEPAVEMPNHQGTRFALRVWWVPGNRLDEFGAVSAGVTYFDTNDDPLLPTRAVEWLEWVINKDGSWEYSNSGGCGSVDQWFMVSNELQAAADRARGDVAERPEIPLLPCASDDMSYSKVMVNCMLDQGILDPAIDDTGLDRSINELNTLVSQHIEQTGIEPEDRCDKF